MLLGQHAAPSHAVLPLPFSTAGIPPERAQRALDLAQGCRSMLVVGSSLAVWSAFRLAKAAVDNGAQFINLSVGGIGFGHDTTLANAISYAFNKNVLVVVVYKF